MTKLSLFSKRSVVILLVGMLVALISMGLFIGVAGAETKPQAVQSTPTPEPQKECAECHLDVNQAWVASPHAHAYDDEVFSQSWDSMGKPGECLACHTTNYQSTTNTFTGEGVRCEACHGEAEGEHPPAVVPVKADTDYCGACHTTTLGEWRLTGHSTAGVGCMDCHDPHSQAALFTDPDELCLNCHREDMGAYLEDLHIQNGIGCVDCHSMVIPPDPLPDDGIVPTGHAFTITTSTCVACHTDTLHAGYTLPGYENGAKAANHETEPTGTQQNAEETTQEIPAIEELTPEQHVQALEAALASSRFSSLFQGGIIGLVLGGMTVYYLSRNRAHRKTDDEDDQPVGTVSEADGEVVDRELEKVLVYIERGLDWVINNLKRASDWAKIRFSSRKKE